GAAESEGDAACSGAGSAPSLGASQARPSTANRVTRLRRNVAIGLSNKPSGNCRRGDTLARMRRALAILGIGTLATACPMSTEQPLTPADTEEGDGDGDGDGEGDGDGDGDGGAVGAGSGVGGGGGRDGGEG